MSKRKEKRKEKEHENGRTFGFDDTSDDKEYISQRKLKEEVEETIQYLTTILYDTSFEPKALEEEVVPFLAEDVVFKDPWQEGGGIQKYTLGVRAYMSCGRWL